MRTLILSLWALTFLVVGVPLLADDMPDDVFLKLAAESNVGKIEAGKLALERTASESVRTFARQSVAEHERVEAELKALARDKSIDLPTEPKPADKSALAKLSRLHGEQFDAEYTTSFGVHSHYSMLALFMHAGRGAKDSDVRAFATKYLAKLQAQATLAEQLTD